MYQNLKSVLSLPPHISRNNEKQLSRYFSQTESVHYLLLPEYREDYINKTIETGVANMQAVIELGWNIRERNSLPLKVRKYTYISG